MYPGMTFMKSIQLHRHGVCGVSDDAHPDEPAK